MKKIVVCLAALTLAGCGTAPKLLAPEYKVVTVPEDLYQCPVKKKFPESRGLTNQQVGSLILELQKNNLTCKNSLDNIKAYLAEAEAKTSKKK
jgi:hypothetical protein